MTTRPTQQELREGYALTKLKLHGKLNKDLKANNLSPQSNCSVAIKVSYENGIINTPKVKTYNNINKMGNMANHDFITPLPTPPKRIGISR